MIFYLLFSVGMRNSLLFTGNLAVQMSRDKGVIKPIQQPGLLVISNYLIIDYFLWLILIVLLLRLSYYQ